MKSENEDLKKRDMKTRVMENIKEKKVKMRSHILFVMEKVGMKGALFLMLLLGAALVSLFFYFIEKIGLEKFLTLGFSGAKIFFLTLPYDYILLFALAVVLAVYFANRIELFCGKCERTDAFAVWFFLGALVLGLFFFTMGIGSFLGGWSKNRIPKEAAIHGRIQYFTNDNVTVVDDEGEMIQVFLPESGVSSSQKAFAKDKFLRAVGKRDQADPSIFHAEKIRCCDDK